METNSYINENQLNLELLTEKLNDFIIKRSSTDSSTNSLAATSDLIEYYHYFMNIAQLIAKKKKKHQVFEIL